MVSATAVNAENENYTIVPITTIDEIRYSNSFLEMMNEQELLTFQKQFARKVDETEKELYGTEIDQIIVLYDQEKGIDLLGVGTGFPILRAYGRSVPFRTSNSEIFASCFYRVDWIQRNGVWSLSLYHTYDGGSFRDGYSKDQGWAALRAVKSGTGHWPSSADNSVKNQYFCHCDFAGALKNPYNLEPSKADKGYWGFVASGCN